MPIFPFLSSTQTSAPAAAAYNEAYNLEYPSNSLLHAAGRDAHEQPATINIFSPSFWLQQPESDNTVLEYTGPFEMHDNNYQYADQLLPRNSDQLQQPNNEESVANSGDYTKKAVHNAMERNRRNKLKALYSELRLLLPNPNKRKLSIPNTVSRVLRYIPELRKEIEELRKQRNELLAANLRISKSSAAIISKSCTGASDHHELMNDFTYCPPVDLSSPIPINVTVNSDLGSSELIITIYARRAHGFLFSTLFQVLEKEGLDVLSASTFLSKHQVICHNLHLEMIGRSEVDTDLLRQKLVTMLCRKSPQAVGFYKSRTGEIRSL